MSIQMNEMATLDRSYFKSKQNPNSKDTSHLTECCENNVDRHILNRNIKDEWELIEARCESRLNTYNKFKSVTPIFCDDCGRLLEYKIELYNKKTW